MIRTIKFLLFSICCWILSGPAISEDSVLQNSGYLHTITLDIQNMDCPLCRVTLRKALEQVPGVESARVDYEHRSAVVIFDPATTRLEDLIKATTNAGYPSSIRTEASNPGAPDVDSLNPLPAE